MSRRSILAAGRRAARAGMVDECRIQRRIGESMDPVTHKVTPEYQVLYTATPCRVKGRGQWSERRKVGEADLNILTREIQLPMGVVGLEPGDEIVITGIGDGRDEDLLDRVFIVRDLGDQTDTTARRPLCMLTTS